MRFWGVVFFLFISVVSNGAVIAPSGFEGAVSFQGRVFVPEQMTFSQRNVDLLVREQVKHLMSVFEQDQYAKLNGARPNIDLGIFGLGEVVRVQLKSVDRKNRIAFYSAAFRVLAVKSYISPQQTRALKIFLPVDPTHFYEPACLDRDAYPGKQYFFYYWNPFLPGCKEHLVGRNTVDVVDAKIVGLVQPEPSVRPNYPRLNANVKRRGELLVSVLLGFDGAARRRGDPSRQTFNFLKEYFTKKAGFRIGKYGNRPTEPFAELLRDKKGNLPQTRIMLDLNASDIANPIVFSRHIRYALENADIVLYIGHSGLGGNLNIPSLTRLSSPNPAQPLPIRFPDFYQIYYINSCGSYFFYAGDYNLAKQGAKNVDLVTNGTASFFESQNIEIVTFLKPFLFPDKPYTWLEILTSIESKAKYNYLLNVSAIRRNP